MPDRLDSPGFQDALDRVRDALRRLPESDARRDTLCLLEDTASAPSPQLWRALHNKLFHLAPSLTLLIDQEFVPERFIIMGSVDKDTDVISVLHSICANFMDAHSSLLDSWRALLRDVVSHFDKDLKLDGVLHNFAVNYARFHPWPEDDSFVIMIDEMYSRPGHYGEICDICEQILEFEHADAQYTLPLAHIERSIASLADHAIAQDAPVDHKIKLRCSKILQKRAKIIGVNATLSSDVHTLKEISKLAHSLAQRHKNHNPAPWTSQYSADYSLMYVHFIKKAHMHGTLSSIIKTEQVAFNALCWISKHAMDAYNANLLMLRDALGTMIVHVKGISLDAALRKYILDMVRLGSGATTELAYYVLSDLCLACKMDMDVCDICEDMTAFRGADAQHMIASALIEHIIGDILYRTIYDYSIPAQDVVKKCATLLRARSDSLKLNLVPDSFSGRDRQKAGLLSLQLAKRNRMHSPAKICSWIRDHYPLSYAFLCPSDRTVFLTNTKSSFASHVSEMINNYDRAHTFKNNYKPNGILDDLEKLLKTMDSMDLVSNHNYDQWKTDMLIIEPQCILFEMSLYSHCKANLDVDLHPKIDDPSSADIRVGKCYVEAYSPFDSFVTAGNTSRSPYLVPWLCCKIMTKSQIESFGPRQSMLVVKCSYPVFCDPYFRELLEKRTQRRQHLGGILLVSYLDDHYKTFFIRNDRADTPVPNDTVKDICDALESKI